MGQEESRLLDESAEPRTLTSRTLEAVAEYVNSGEVRRIVVLTGAGISTSAGIPDFRSPKTGLYANLARLNLPYAEAVFDISYFRKHPEPFYVLARELYPGKFHPTVSHAFIALLAQKGLLHVLFTQNIDCLERSAGVPGEKIVEAHGSFATQRCVDCREEFDAARMREHVEKGEVPRCEADGCGGLVKPDIVFFGEALPSEFRDRAPETSVADLVLILGTSLTVFPFAGLPELAEAGKPRVLFNMERVGGIGVRADDVVALGPCDAKIRELADHLGWRDELERLWRGIVGDEEAERQLASSREQEDRGISNETEEEVDDLARKVERVLALQDEETEKGDEKDETTADIAVGSGTPKEEAAQTEEDTRQEASESIPSATAQDVASEGKTKDPTPPVGITAVDQPSAEFKADERMSYHQKKPDGSAKEEESPAATVVTDKPPATSS
ncbi:hypothetical protein N3K66_000558 [Trichothecium roseum]|uniref:Uncharacterized protein n=1 Tax=Trichothecium roseum TaxID=47278 RepID=A0ACC0VC94_9HYPO|nr:hypothetical protein N3K66_000558 [Trichothecium roseum]